MIKNINEIKNILSYGYDYIIVPKNMMDTKVELSTMVMVDENDNEVGYASMNDLKQELGSFFQPIEITNNYIAYRWSYDIGTDEHKGFGSYLESMGLVNIRTGDEYDFSIPNGYAMCSLLKFSELKSELDKLKEVE